MRLLNSKTLELEEFFEYRNLKYAILSHRWQDEEVSFQDMQNGAAANKKGYTKLKSTCDQAVKDGLKYVWVDTCCIDKTSSAELSESINSMYRWYQHSFICYAYLFDVHSKSISEDSSFEESQWFTRAWTLQELIAPHSVEFYNSTWQKLGDKRTLISRISAITGIHEHMLAESRHASMPSRVPMLNESGEVATDDFSIAMRMSWASKRTATKVEDMAYSLLGIFGVNMPLLYGEGEGAFIRLQEEIMKNSDDQSLFAWELTGFGIGGLLAPSPAAFGSCSNIVRSKSKWNRIPYSITNMGMSIEMRTIPWAMETYFTALDCEVQGVPDSRMGIFMKLHFKETNQYARVLVKGMDSKSFKSALATESEYRQMYVRQQHNFEELTSFDKPLLYGFWIRSLPTKIVTTSTSGGDQIVSEVTSWNRWNDEERIIKIPTGSRGTAGVIWYGTESGHCALKLGFDASFNPVCQFGGRLSTSKNMAADWSLNNIKTRRMDSSWVLLDDDWVFRGDRLSGLIDRQPPRQISITRERIKMKKIWTEVWVLDIARMEAQNALRHDFTCDGCGLSLYGTSHKCLVCPGIKYCPKCILTASETHGSHEFQAVEVQKQLK